MTVEQLINMPVISAGKKSQRLSQTAAAVFVISQEDIRRSGVTSVPEALRMAPGIQVARINTHSWAISSRGFNGLFANKLLVLIDGRSVYTPLFSGVYWDTQDLMLEDVDRIEVIRGPGATLWGANAVNGVINIITKNAKDTKGGLLSAGGGSEERYFGGLRYGGDMGDSGAYRLFGKGFSRDGSNRLGEESGDDDWQGAHGGFRADWELDADTFSLAGDGHYQEKSADFLTPSLEAASAVPTTDNLYLNGANLIGRWLHKHSEGSETQLQGYYEHVERDDSVIEHDRDTFDLEVQQRQRILESHELIGGLGYRASRDHIDGTFVLSADPSRRTSNLFTAFLQDDYSLTEKTHFILGSKLEHTEFTGFEVQPNARFLTNFSEGHTFWTAISRAVRTPSRIANDGTINVGAFRDPDSGLPGLLSVRGSGGYDSEDLLAYEMGYRALLTPRFSLDLALFLNEYDDLQTAEPGSPILSNDPLPTHLVVPFTFENKAEGTTHGLELVADWSVASTWRLVGTYSYLDVDIDLDSDSLDRFASQTENENPTNQFMIRSQLDLPYSLELDSSLRYVSALTAASVDAYYDLDIRLGWRPVSDLELSIVGQNLLDDDHFEFAPADFVVLQSHELERGVYGKLTWRF